MQRATSCSKAESCPWKLSLIKTYPQIIGYDIDVYNYFAKQYVNSMLCKEWTNRTRANLCGLDINLTYPQTGGHFPSIVLLEGTDNREIQESSDDGLDNGQVIGPSRRRRSDSPIVDNMNGFVEEVAARYFRQRKGRVLRQSSKFYKRTMQSNWKRDLRRRENDSIDPWYGCYVWNEMVDYAVNYTYPWSESAAGVR
jgi:carboxypeptidase D